MRSENVGGRARVATLLLQVADVTAGNKDGVVGNEQQRPNILSADPLSIHPLPFRVARALSVGLSKSAKQAELSRFVDGVEARWNAPAVSIERPPHVAPADWAAFRVRKAITCERFERSPASITELVVPARGRVDDVRIVSRDMFVQRYAPQGGWSGTTVVFAPGYGESGRTFVEQAIAANALGHEAYVLDQPWLGLSQGKRGEVDRGFGVALPIAAVTAKAAQEARARRHDANVVIAGTSLGGMGSYVAIRMNELRRVELEGPPMPDNVGGVLSSPYFAVHERLDTLTRAACSAKWLANLPMPRITASPVTDDPITKHKLVAHSILERINGRLQAFHAPDTDLARLAQLELAATLERDQVGDARICVIHGARDPLASYEAAAEWVHFMGPRARLISVDSMNHAMAENPQQQRLLFEGIGWVTKAH